MRMKSRTFASLLPYFLLCRKGPTFSSVNGRSASLIASPSTSASASGLSVILTAAPNAAWELPRTSSSLAAFA